MIELLSPLEGRMLAPRARSFVICWLVVVASFLLPLAANPQASHPESSQASKNNSSGPAALMQVSTRMVALEVVAKDHQGHHATGLTAADFQVFEQTPSRGKEKREQKIAVFREVRMADLAAQTGSALQVPPGVYTNLVTPQKDPVPATILLVDGLNTDVKFQTQVHVQMVRMLKSLPKNVPVAVFLLGYRLRMLQGFTTDPSLLQAALEKSRTPAGAGVARLDPRDDPDMLSAQFDQMNDSSGGNTSGPSATSATHVAVVQQWVIDAVKKFEQEVYASTMDTRVQQTIDALISLGHHVGGYPGRKNLLWISTSFPISLSPLVDDKPTKENTGLDMAGMRDYWPKLKMLESVLSDAKVAVYPINPAGVQAPTLFDSQTRIRDRTARGAGDTLRRETMMRENEQNTMQVLAEGTGGQVCTGTNDLAECIRKATDDSSTFYEIAYYPDSQSWNGEYRKIILKSRQSGLRLAYRDGYFAKAEGGENATDQKTELQSACRDYLDATSIFLAAKRLPGDSPEGLKFYLMANLNALTLAPMADGGHELNVTVAACTFDKDGSPVQMMTEGVNRKFDAKAYQSLTAAGGFAHVVSIPGSRPAAVRLIVKDLPSGRLGSVHIKVDDTVAAAPPAPPVNNAPQTPAVH
jgi:VWFA-related protein